MLKRNSSIVVNLKGGLGNQCFEYAAARSLSLETSAKLFLRADSLIGDGCGRQFALADFNCEYEIPPYRSRVRRALTIRYENAVERLGVRRFGNLCIEKRHKLWDPLPQTWHGKIVLRGYFQSEKYFYDHRHRLMEDFSLRDNSWLRLDQMAAQIKTRENSISLHVRSYKEVPGRQDGSMALPVSYYINALNYLRSNLSHGTVFLFSDDVIWAEARLHDVIEKCGFECVPVLPDNSLLPHDRYSSVFLRDFTLMRMCGHAIVANSTFSWWTAWLGEQDAVTRGEHPICIRVNRESDNDFWPKRWISVCE